jgi:hypothetical protein
MSVFALYSYHQNRHATCIIMNLGLHDPESDPVLNV